MMIREAVQYYSVRPYENVWVMCAAGRPVWLGDRHYTFPTEAEAQAVADQRNAALTPTMGARCPMCGSSRTYNDGDWVVCQSCGTRSK